MSTTPRAGSRSGSETRARRYQVGVRLSPTERVLLQTVAEVDGISPGEVLRRAFMEVYRR